VTHKMLINGTPCRQGVWERLNQEVDPTKELRCYICNVPVGDVHKKLCSAGNRVYRG